MNFNNFFKGQKNNSNASFEENNVPNKNSTKNLSRIIKIAAVLVIAIIIAFNSS